MESVIIPLMTAGMNVMTFHPRGMWDTQHQYTLTGALDDLLAAAAFVRSTADGVLKTFTGNTWRTDPERIAVMGLSGGGGNVSLSACAEDPHIRAAIAVAANGMSGARTPDGNKDFSEHFDVVRTHTAGRVDVERGLSGMSQADLDRMNPIAQANALAGKDVLLIGAQYDHVASLETCHRPIAEALRGAALRTFNEVIFETDHAFLTKRIALARLTVQWLRTTCGF